ncbi:MAG: exodeoxyribonuclease VII large subunit [Acidimicrobiales bacterium]
MPGWSATLVGGALGGPATGVTWVGGPAPDDLRLPITLGPLPNEAGRLQFKAVQTHDNGEVHSWIEDWPAGAPEPASPGPVLDLVAGGPGSIPPTTAPTTTTTTTTAPTTTTEAAETAAGPTDDAAPTAAFSPSCPWPSWWWPQRERRSPSYAPGELRAPDPGARRRRAALALACGPVAVEQPRLIEEPTMTVADLCAGIGRALARAYPEAVWVRGEIANKHLSPQGHVFFDLVDGDGGARVRVVLWRTDRTVVNRTLRRSGHSVRIDDGTEVRIRADVGWHPRHGVVRLRMLAIDTAYTLGRLAEARERLLRTLDNEGLLARQARLELALVPLRVGLVTSATSAASADFLTTLETSGFAWQVTLTDVRVQGPGGEASVLDGLAAVAGVDTDLDVVCVVRGGGARTDLATFDREAVARAVAGCAVPVLTGIGHETDSTVVDLVAHRSFKTPTACASFLVERVGAYLDAGGRAWHGIQTRARHHLRTGELVVDAAARRLSTRPLRLVDAAERDLDRWAARLDGLDPTRLLARGWTVTRRGDGRLVRSAAELAGGDTIVTTFADGDVTSRVDDPVPT